MTTVTETRLLGESRWPPIAAVLAFMALNITVRLWLPSEGVTRVPWLVPAIEAVLIVVLVTSNPTGAAERHRLRLGALTLVGILVAASLWATVQLIHDLIDGVGVTNKPSELLASGGIVWLGNNLAFALLYWLMDGGGPIARTRLEVPVDFAFTQQMSPELAPPGWRPVFLDYLHLGFTNATAFSPTDVMPLTLRAKHAMLVQSTVALALFGLVVARAVNAFTQMSAVVTATSSVERRLELVSTVLLALATVATAWSAQQSRQWTGQQAEGTSKAERASHAVRDAAVPREAQADAGRLEIAAAAASQDAKEANKHADNYMLAVVLFATSPFFAGISNKLQTVASRELTLGLGCVLFLGTLIWLATLPVHLTT